MPSVTVPMRRLLIAVTLAVTAAVGAAIVPPAAAPLIPALSAFDAPAVLAADDIDIGTTARYVVVPDKAVVRVTVNVVATNQKPNQTTNGVVTRYFYDGVNLGIQPEATRVRATQGGHALQSSSVKRAGYRLVTVLFGSNLFFGDATKFKLAFDLPAGAPRSASDIRVGAAFASFLAWSFGDHGTVRVDVPAGFAVDVTGAPMEEATAADGTQVYTATTASSIDWYAWLNARNDAGLTREQLMLTDGEQIVIRGWPEDARWRSRVSTILTQGVPDLVRRIGLPWPVDGPLNVLEIHTPLLEGYAGFFDTANDEITISEDLDNLTIVHEASHAWFNRDLFVERWITEGLADEYASLVLGDTGHKAPSPDPVKPTAKIAFPLNDWPPPAPISDSQSDAREQFGYDAAWTVIRAVVKAAGEDGMRRVFAAAADHTTAYIGAGKPEPARLPNDWRRFLDLTEEVGGATGVADLLATWALPADDRAILADRATARDDYHALVAAGDGWVAPTVVRLALDDWSFADAEARIADADAILALRDRTATLAASLDLTPPGILETDYEGARTAADLAAATSLATDTGQSLQAIDTAAAAAAAPRDWVVNLGLVGKDPDGELALARTEWEAGSIAAATESAILVSGTLAVAADAGRGRAIIIGCGIALILLVISLIALAYRQRRRARARRLAAAGAVTAFGAVPPDLVPTPDLAGDTRPTPNPPPPGTPPPGPPNPPSGTRG